MDFSKLEIPKILKSGMLNRFMDFSPQDFEDFISQLFRDNGYIVEQTKYSRDYGVDLIIKKNGEHIAIQVKRYAKINKVGVKDINQVLGGKNYYKCNKAIVITTSSFTKPAETLAQKTNVELWDWNKLQKYICDTYLDGKNYFEYFKKDLIRENNLKDFSVDVFKVIYKQPLKRSKDATLIFVKITNLTDKNLDVVVKLPTYITSNNNQIEATAYLEGYFVSGIIYAGCTVTSCFIFDYEQLPKVRIGDKLVVPLFYNEKTVREFVNIEKEIPFISNCFIATAVYGTPFSNEVEILKYWRDNKLRKSYIGKLFIKFYYILSPSIANFIKNKPLLKKVIKIILNFFIRYLKRRQKTTKTEVLPNI